MPPLILLTNDDGIDADGIRALEAALPATWECHVVAPTSVMSQCGHRVTTDEPLRVHARGENRHAVQGTPADCVRLALTHLLPRQPDWVLSGINEGGNLGADIYVSGTVAAVREAAFLGVPGIALSHFKKRGLDFDWDWASRCVWKAIDELLAVQLGRGEHWNINLPHVSATDTPPDRVHCEPSQHPLPVSFALSKEQGDVREFAYDGDYPSRLREEGSDIDICFGGQISVSKLSL